MKLPARTIKRSPQTVDNSVRFKAKPGLFLLLLAIIFLLSFYRNSAKIRAAHQKIEDAESAVNSIRNENEEMKANLEAMKSEAFIEKQLRDKLGLAKKDEIVLVLPEDDVLRRLVPKEKKEEVVLPDPNWKKWMDLFFY